MPCDLIDLHTGIAQLNDTVDDASLCVRLRLRLERGWSGGVEHWLEIFLDLAERAKDFSEGAVRVHVAEIIGLDRPPVAEKDPRHFAVREAANKIASCLPQHL